MSLVVRSAGKCGIGGRKVREYMGDDGHVSWHNGKVTQVSTIVLVLFDSDKKVGDFEVQTDTKLTRLTGATYFLSKGDRVEYRYPHGVEPGEVQKARTTVWAHFATDDRTDEFDLPNDELRRLEPRVL